LGQAPYETPQKHVETKKNERELLGFISIGMTGFYVGLPSLSQIHNPPPLPVF
jgi:hypothetical protein